jgi:hypothetical protein
MTWSTPLSAALPAAGASDLDGRNRSFQLSRSRTSERRLAESPPKRESLNTRTSARPITLTEEMLSLTSRGSVSSWSLPPMQKYGPR